MEGGGGEVNGCEKVGERVNERGCEMVRNWVVEHVLVGLLIECLFPPRGCGRFISGGFVDRVSFHLCFGGHGRQVTLRRTGKLLLQTRNLPHDIIRSRRSTQLLQFGLLRFDLLPQGSNFIPGSVITPLQFLFFGFECGDFRFEGFDGEFQVGDIAPAGFQFGQLVGLRFQLGEG